MIDYETGECVREKDYTKPYLSGFPGPINLGNPGEVPVRTLAEKIIELTGSPSGLIFESLPDDDPRRRCPDIMKAKTLLQWEPRVPLDDGLRQTIDYFIKRGS
jgi:UDP-glucuronate decarboxylase